MTQTLTRTTRRTLEEQLGVTRSAVLPLATFLGYQPAHEEMAHISTLVLAKLDDDGDPREFCIARDSTGRPTGELVLYTHTRATDTDEYEYEDTSDEPADMWQYQYEQSYD